MYRFRKTERNKKGFTLAEVLIVVGILLVLFAISVPSLFAIRKNLRQTALDDNAETIYVAVQNRMTKMKEAGLSSAYQPRTETKASTLAALPSDAASGISAGDIAYFTSTDYGTAGTAANAVMSDTSLEASLINEHWVVEYNPSSGVVYAVFYSEDLAECNAEYMTSYSTYDTSYRYKDGRLEDGAEVGYYGGGASVSGSKVTEISPSITVENAEKLTAQIKCTIPSGLEDQPVFKIEMEDTAGNKYTAYYAYWGVTAEYKTKIKQETGTDPLFCEASDTEQITKSGRTYTLNLTLDDLSSDSTRFVNQYGEGSGHGYGKELLCGTPLKITVTALCPGNKTVTGTHSATVITNSLFADDHCAGEDTPSNPNSLNQDYGKDDDNAAVITYCRHLQNLDESSGVVQNDDAITSVSAVRYAVQADDLDFAADSSKKGIYDWYETYSSDDGTYFNGNLSDGNANFKAITNSALYSYSGSYAEDSSSDPVQYEISNLTEERLAKSGGSGYYNDTDLGLFSSLGTSGSAAQTLSDIVLVRTKITSSGGGIAVGALAGSSSGNVTITGCQVYLTGSDLGYGSGKKSNETVWISGSIAGGLVGDVKSGSLTVSDSAASTVVGGYSSVTRGADGTIQTIDTYTTSVAGGLIGRISSGTVSVSTSYADCYTAGTKAGGLVGSGSSGLTVDSCYSSGFVSFTDSDNSAAISNAGTTTNSYSVVRGLYLKSDVQLKVNNANSSNRVYYVPSSEQMNVLVNTGKFESSSSASSTPELYHLMKDIPDTYDYPVLKSVAHYGDYTKGVLLTLMNGTTSYSTTVWSNMVADSGVVENISSIAEYNTPTGGSWTLVGWYLGHDMADTMILDKDGNITADVGEYEGLTISKNSSGKKVLTLSKNVTLYACWKKGATGEIYVLVNTFSYDGKSSGLTSAVDLSKCNKYLIASGNSGNVDVVTTDGTKLTSSSAEVLTDGVYSANPYIMVTDTVDAYAWTAIPSEKYLNTTDIQNLNSASGWTNNNTSADYGSAFHLTYTVDGQTYYLHRNVTDSANNTGNMTVTKTLYDSSNSWYFENRMFKYGTDNLRGRYCGSTWSKVLYFSYSGGSLSSEVLSSGDSVPSGSKKAYIYERQEVDTASYSFDIDNIQTLTYMDGSTTLSTITFPEDDTITLCIADYPADRTDSTGKTLTCDGWSTSNGGTVVYTKGTTASFSSDTVLYAHWTSSYTVTFYPNSGSLDASVVNPLKVSAASSTITLPTPTRYGYNFAGWQNQSTGTVKTGTDTITTSTAYTATWTYGLSVSKSANVSAVTVGDQIVYTIMVKNDTATEVTGLTVTDTLPSNITFTSIAPSSHGTCSGNTVTWSDVSIAANSNTVFTVIVTTAGDVTSTIMTTNTAKLKDTDGTESKSTSVVAVKPQTFTITWKNADGTVLKTDSVTYGTTPAYSGTTPTKTATAQYTYTFKGWDSDITAATKDTTYIAVYDQNVRSYTITWLDWNGSVLGTDTLDYGATPSYSGSAPVRTGDAKYSYTFGGWDKPIAAVTGDASYQAQYTETINQYKITWLDADGNTLRTDYVEYDATPSYGSTPTKAASGRYTYVFKGWTPAVSKVTGDATYKAQFRKRSSVKFHIGGGTVQTLYYYDDSTSWYNDDDTVAVLSTPTLSSSYTFAGWSLTNSGKFSSANASTPANADSNNITEVYACWSTNMFTPATSFTAGNTYLIAAGSSSSSFYYNGGGSRPSQITLTKNTPSETIYDGSGNLVSGGMSLSSDASNYLWTASKNGSYFNLSNGGSTLSEIYTTLTMGISAKWSLTSDSQLKANERSFALNRTWTFSSTYVYSAQTVYTYAS